MAALTAEQYTAPAKKWSRTDKVHRQSWAQQAAADNLNMPKEAVRNMTPGSLLVIQEARYVDGVHTWGDVPERGTSLLGITRFVLC